MGPSFLFADLLEPLLGEGADGTSLVVHFNICKYNVNNLCEYLDLFIFTPSEILPV